MNQTNGKIERPESPVATLDYSHPMESWLKRDWVRFLLRKISADRPGSSEPHLLRALQTYGNDRSPLHERLLYWPIHKIIDSMRGALTPAELYQKLGGHPPTIRGIVATARSIAKYGLTVPQRWEFPLFVVWNFTNRCNLRCRHCYQSSGPELPNDELSLDEKLKLIDQLNRMFVPMVALAGGEPTLSDHLEPVLARCQSYGIHTTIATHGALLTGDRCRRLADLGVRYVEVSLDSIDPETHDLFRGIPGTWKRAVQGIKNVVETEGLRAGIAMCITRENVHELESMLQFAVDLGVSCFAHFNFIPVGRGMDMAAIDLTPSQREEVLHTLRDWMNTQKLGVISTAPQFGRMCLMHTDQDSLMSCSHAGNASGAKARVVAKYLGGCGAGRTYACLQPNGDLTPCVYMPDRIMGNVRQKSIRTIFQESEWWDLFCNRDEREGHCGVCDYRNYCGGCRARADAYFNRLDHSDPGCIYNQDVWEKINQQNGAGATIQSLAPSERTRRSIQNISKPRT